MSPRRFGIMIHDFGMDATSFLFTSAYAVDELDVAFMLQNTCGLLAVTVSEPRAADLNIQHLPRQIGRPDWGLTVDAREGITTGVSAADRAATAALLASRNTVASQLVRPGHMLVALQRPSDMQSWIGPAAALTHAQPCSGGEPALFGQLLTTSQAAMSAAEAEQFATIHGCHLTRASELLMGAVAEGAEIHAVDECRGGFGEILAVQLAFDSTEHYLFLPTSGESVVDHETWLNDAKEVVICANWTQACTDCRYQVLDGQQRHTQSVIAVVDPLKHARKSRPELMRCEQLDLSSAYEQAVIQVVKQQFRAVRA